jgi:hypothetical protein
MLGHFFPLRKAARIGRVRQLAVGLAAVALCVQAAAAADAPVPPKGTTNWGGLGWGIGIATDFDVGGNRVVNASVVNNIVRLTDTSSNVGISFVLEAHYFFTDWAVPFLNTGCTSTNKDPYVCNNVGIGPFVAIEVGDGTTATPSATGIITSFAMGAMVGFRHPNLPGASATSSWNLGIGFRVDPKAQVLGDGLFPNQPLPAGDSIRWKTEPRYGVMLLSSFSF